MNVYTKIPLVFLMLLGGFLVSSVEAVEHISVSIGNECKEQFSVSFLAPVNVTQYGWISDCNPFNGEASITFNGPPNVGVIITKHQQVSEYMPCGESMLCTPEECRLLNSTVPRDVLDYSLVNALEFLGSNALFTILQGWVTDRADITMDGKPAVWRWFGPKDNDIRLSVAAYFPDNETRVVVWTADPYGLSTEWQILPITTIHVERVYRG